MGKRHRSAGEGSISKRKDGRWEGNVNLGFDAEGRRRRIRFCTRTRKEAQERLSELLQQQTKGTIVAVPENLTVGDYLQRWLRDYAATGVRPKTYHSYSQLARLHLVPSLGAIPLAHLQPLHLQSLYAAKLKAGLSPRSVRYLHAILHKALDHAVRWELAARNVADAVDPPRLHHREMAVLTSEQAAAFTESAAPDRLHALYVVALTTGMRQGEILALRWQDVGLDTGSIYVKRTLHRLHGEWLFAEPKSARSRRHVALPAVATTALRRHLEQQQWEKEMLGSSYHDQGLVFCKAGGDPFDGSWLTHHTQRLLKKAGLPAVRFHDFRHSHATMMLQQGVHPKIVSDRLGHSSIKLTLDTYSHVLPAMQREAADKVDDLFRRQRRRPQPLDGEVAD